MTSGSPITPIEKLIYERLTVLRKSLRWLREASSIDRRTIKKIMHTNVIPNFFTAQKLCWALQINLEPESLPLSKPLRRPSDADHPLYQEIARKAYEHGVSYCEIMRLIGVSQNAVRAVTHHGRELDPECQQRLDLL